VVPELDALVMELLSKDPDERSGDATAVLARLAVGGGGHWVAEAGRWSLRRPGWLAESCGD